MNPGDLMPSPPEVEHYKGWDLLKYDMLTEVYDGEDHLFSIPTLDLERSPHILAYFYQAFEAGRKIGQHQGVSAVQWKIKDALSIS